MNRREFLKSLAIAYVVGNPSPSLLASEVPGTSCAGPKLPQRVLGKTGVQVSALALGGVIGMQLPPSTDHDPAALADTALDLGITYFDTAPSYNNGQSETNYGQVLARRRKEVFLATKTGDRTHDGTLRSIEQSLKRLRTDRVDLIQIHGLSATENLDAWEKPDGVLTALRKLRAIIAKELRSYFVSPVVYAVGSVFLLTVGLLADISTSCLPDPRRFSWCRCREAPNSI